MFLKNLQKSNFLKLPNNFTSYLNLNQKSNNNFLHNFQQFTFATKMRAGVTKNKKDSPGKRLGLKKYGGGEVREDQIIIRQRGLRWKAGENVHVGKDQTLHASKEGIIKFTQDPWSRRRKISVHVVEQEVANRKIYHPKPFMYHPELYPELAKNNVTPEPLTINYDIKVKKKSEITKLKKEAKKNNVEFSKIHSEINLDRTANNLRNSILKSAKASCKVDVQQYSKKFEIQPLLDEITQIGVTYFIPNTKLEYNKNLMQFKYSLTAEEKGENPYPVGLFGNEDEEFVNGTNNLPEDFTFANPTYIMELYAKHAHNEKGLKPFREILVDLKKQEMLEMSLDIRSVPEGGEKINFMNEKIYSEVLLGEKIKYEGMLKNFDSLKDEEIKILFNEFEIESKEELKNKIEKYVKEIEVKIVRKYLELNTEENKQFKHIENKLEA